MRSPFHAPAALLIVFLLASVGCGDSTGPTNTAPTIAITNDLGASVVPEDALVKLEATASDAEEGDLSASVQWSSSIDGALGIGGTLSTSSLSIGTHSIEARVADAEGESASTSVQLEVVVAPDRVLSMEVITVSDTALSLQWTEVDDGLGAPADYAVRMGSGAGSTPTGTVGEGSCASALVDGAEIGQTASCHVTGLEPGSEYVFLVLSARRLGDGSHVLAESALGAIQRTFTDFVEDFDDDVAGEPPSPSSPKVSYTSTNDSNQRSVLVAESFGPITDQTLVLTDSIADTPGGPNFTIDAADPFVSDAVGGMRISFDVAIGGPSACQLIGLAIPGEDVSYWVRVNGSDWGGDFVAGEVYTIVIEHEYVRGGVAGVTRNGAAWTFSANASGPVREGGFLFVGGPADRFFANGCGPFAQSVAVDDIKFEVLD